MQGSVSFCLRIAELVFSVQGSDTARALCRDYEVREGEAACSIDLSPEAIDAERALLRRKNDPGADSPEEVIEALALCRALAEYLPFQDRVLFHGSSLAIDGKGVLFTAKSGTGKSTHTRLWREVFGDRVVMVNDDKPFLHIAPEGATVYGTPWRGKHRLGSNISAPLKAICIVCRGEENRMERVTPRAALPVLLQQTYMPEDPRMLQRTVALADRLSRTVPIYKLYCNMDPEAAVVAYGGLNLEE